MAVLASKLAAEIGVNASQIQAAISLMDNGASVPFIARYRKEITGGLDDIQLRLLESRLVYVRELNERRDRIIESIAQQQKMTPQLLNLLNDTNSKSALEDIYLPYRPRKTSKAIKARDAGLTPFADTILTQAITPAFALHAFCHADYPDLNSQLDGISAILIDNWATNATLLNHLRPIFAANAILQCRLATESSATAAEKFKDYFHFDELLSNIAPHRLLAMLRGKQEGFLKLNLVCDDTQYVPAIITMLDLNSLLPSERQSFLHQTATLLWQGKLRPHLETSLLAEKRQAAEKDAIQVFASNLRHLLLAAPAGSRCTLGVDPGIRTGVKLAVVASNGVVLEHSTIYPFQPKNDTAGAMEELLRLCTTHPIDLIAIGNGTASRETERLFIDLCKKNPQLSVTRVIVSEAGASVYSASELASKELPTLDVSIRGAVSIARRLQDPLAELVKINPKSIGVGQYQHDVNQTHLAATLDSVIEDCVNAVGVDVNTASPALLTHVAGLNSSIAQQLTDYRSQHGLFTSRNDLKKVPRFGAKTFEQAAGFLRITGGTEPLDRSAVHPESYSLVDKILKKTGLTLAQLIGNSDVLKQLNPVDFAADSLGIPTVIDVIAELDKPGRDPRPEFKTVNFRDDIQSISDLASGQILEGIVTNVTNFGAFIDIGVHQDGLAHISELSNKFISNPQHTIKPGQIVKVRVLDVEIARKRISLSLNLTAKDTPKSKSSNSMPAASNTATDSNTAKKSTSTHHVKTARKPSSQSLSNHDKTGSLGALLLQAGVKKTSGT